ncbi:hypothetical protein UT300005_15510 [Clostridium sp. CTA-5]
MFKRANKMTALLVAAAAVVSLVPATGVNAADYKRIESKDGKVYDAVAYKNGAFVIDGNVKDGDTDAVYFLNNGKYSPLEDVDTGVTFGIYGEKYATVDTDDYYVDLTNGKVSDDKVAEDNADDAATALRKKIKDKADDRYSDDAALKTGLSAIEGSRFGETWYETTYTSAKNTNGGASTALNVYTDAKANYIDADYNLGKVKVRVSNGTTTSSAVTIENTDDKYDSIAKDDLSAKVTNAKVIGQDSSNIYRTATITVSATTGCAVSEINGVDVTKDAATFVTTDAYKTVSFEVIQKISKAQASGDVDGAKYAKSVTNYVISNEKGENKELLSGANFTITGGKVIAYAVSGGKVNAQTIELKSSKGFYYTDITKADEEDATVVQTDVDGNLWMLDGGFVYKFDNDDSWDKVYKVDGSMDKMSVYNKDNMVVWNEDDEVYSVIGNKEEETEKPVEVTKGWVQAADGTWTYVKEDGTKATGWLNLNGTWYFLNAEGVMQTGWINANGTWYYTNASGAMQTGWANVNGTWYFLNASGAMQTGWVNDNGTWYFCNASGAMQANTVVDGYTLGANGAWIR